MRVDIELITMILILICRSGLGQPGALVETGSSQHRFLRLAGYSTSVMEGGFVDVSPIRHHVPCRLIGGGASAGYPSGRSPLTIAKGIFPIQDNGQAACRIHHLAKFRELPASRYSGADSFAALRAETGHCGRGEVRR